MNRRVFRTRIAELHPHILVICSLWPAKFAFSVMVGMFYTLHYKERKKNPKTFWFNRSRNVLSCPCMEMRVVVIWSPTSPFFFALRTHTHTHSYTLEQYIGRTSGFRLHSGAFILTCMSALCLSKMCSASPVFSLQVGSQIKLGSTGRGAYKHTRQAEWLVMTFQTFTTVPPP